jgi:hypothetical protein
MPKTIEQGFDDFHTRLTPNLTESKELTSFRKSLNDCLVSNFGMTNFFRTGSTGNGTGVSGYSDADYFAVIPTENLKKNSASSLREIREVLEKRFPRTGIYVDSPGVVCPFGQTAVGITEIVPADYIKESNGNKIYHIPDTNDGWMYASPLAHNKYVTGQNDRLSKKVKPLIRFLKAWKYMCNVPISSFYLEIRVTKYCEGENSIVYSIDIKKIIKYLLDNELPAVIDPTGISGYIYPCKTETKKTDALSKLNTALSRAEKARDAEGNNNIKDAFYWWNMFFNGNFPSYS